MAILMAGSDLDSIFILATGFEQYENYRANLAQIRLNFIFLPIQSQTKRHHILEF